MSHNLIVIMSFILWRSKRVLSLIGTHRLQRRPVCTSSVDFCKFYGCESLRASKKSSVNDALVSRQLNFLKTLSSMRLFSSASPNSGKSNPSRRGDNSSVNPQTSTTSALESYLSELVNQGVLSSQEIESIGGALFNPSWDQILPPTADDVIMKIIPQSIEVYLTQKMRRIELGGEAIGNPGLYVRSVMKKNMGRQGIDTPDEKQATRGGNNFHVGDTNLESIISSFDIQQSDLNEKCLIALSRSPIQTAKYALDVFAKQTRRREMKGIKKILDPSSYILAVLRNAPESLNEHGIEESPNIPPGADGTAQHERDEPGLKREISYRTSSVSDAEQMNGDSTNTKFKQLQPTLSEDYAGMLQAQNTQEGIIEEQITTHGFPEPSEETSYNSISSQSERVSIEYANRCISYLANLETPIIKLSGVGPKSEKSFHKLGLYTLRDLLWHFPRHFVDRSKLCHNIREVPDGDIGTFLVKVNANRARHNTVPCTDEAGNDFAVTFFYGQSRQGRMAASASLEKLCKMSEAPVIVSGKVKHSEKGTGIFNPDHVVSRDEASNVLGVEPVYGLAAGLTKKKLVSAIEEALKVAHDLLSVLPESLPDSVLEELSWPKLADALVLSHKPKEFTEFPMNSPARQRLAFEELCMQQAQLALTRWRLKYLLNDHSSQLSEPDLMYRTWQSSPLVSAAVSALPFELRPSQQECLEELWADAIGRNNGRMLRLLQGDVGSGKTCLGYLLGLGCIESRQGGGRVVAILAPTQLLASQHAQTIGRFADALNNAEPSSTIKNVRIELLTGGVTASKREDLLSKLEEISTDEAVFLVGTHALLTPDVVNRLKNLPGVSTSKGKGLALAVIDEEQRLGVKQREKLAMCAAHSLYMSATPIPRTIALKGSSGLMDFTILDGIGSDVETVIVPSKALDKVVLALKSKIDKGSKAFWVLPKIGQNDTVEEHSIQQNNVLGRHRALAEAFGQERVSFVHGRMKGKDREEQLARFADPLSRVDVLVSTTVIEVGIDVPDVNVMIVEDADRFGLSQLHQLRGRIGRAGSREILKCHYILLSSVANNGQTDGVDSLSKLEVLRESTCGSVIADADYMLRGPGDTLGFLQSGIKNGRTLSSDHHWELTDAAALYGRRFMQPLLSITTSDRTDSTSTATNILMRHFAEEKAQEHFCESYASCKQGFAMRVMMTLFSEFHDDSHTQKNSAHDTISALHDFNPPNCEDDRIIHGKFVALLQSIDDGSIEDLDISSSDEINEVMSSSPVSSSTHNSMNRSDEDYYMNKADVQQIVNSSEDGILYMVLDVETTGLDYQSSHIIQLAAKELGSDNEDIFSEYILPPIDKIPSKIVKLTGITDDFLRNGGHDMSLGIQRGPARSFREVFSDFHSFCREKARGRQICLIAHNARFDIGMLESELRRCRNEVGDAKSLHHVFDMSLDTNRLFRVQEFWRSRRNKPTLPKPESFALSALHLHVFNDSFEDSHNAVGDIKALERLLLSEQFNGWERVSRNIRTPFIDPYKVVVGMRSFGR